jgi:hypothetical protein
MKPLHLFIELQESALVKFLQEQLQDTRAALAASQEAQRNAEFKLRNEQSINMELMDLCKTNGIKFRKALDVSKWAKDA